MITVEIPIRDKKKPPALKFPERCAHCGKPKHVVLPLKLNMGAQTRKGQVMMDFPVPLCAECERKERRITNVTLVPFLVAGLIFGLVAFVPPASLDAGTNAHAAGPTTYQAARRPR